MGLIVNYHHHIYPDFSLVCRLQKELHLQNLRVRVEKEGDLTISFCGSQELDENNMLCEMDVELPPPKNDPALACLLYTSPSPRDQRGSRMPSSA